MAPQPVPRKRSTLALFRRTEEPAGYSETLLEAAAASRDAAVWAFVLNQDDALDHLARSVDLYARAGLPYSLFLQTLVGLLGREPTTSLGSVYASLLETAVREEQDLRDFPTARLQPQQQAYAFLAFALTPQRSRELEDVVGTVRRSRLAYSTLPIGAAGRPIRGYVALGGEIADATERRRGYGRSANESERATVDAILDLARVGAERLDLAASNTYLWQNAAAPVEILDVDLAAFTAAAVSAYGASVRDAITRQIELARSPYVRFQLSVALDIADGGGAVAGAPA